MTFLPLLIIACIVFSSISNSDFCSTYCKYDNCIGADYNQCGACSTYFVYDSAQKWCTLDPTLNWIGIAEYQPTTSLSLPLLSSNATATSATCNSNSFTYVYDRIIGPSTIRFSLTGGTSVPHYSMRFYAWVMLIDNWDSTARVNATLVSTGISIGKYRNQKQRNGNRCGGGGWGTNQQYWFHFKQTYFHNTSDVDIDFDLIITSSNTADNTKGWGFKDVFIIAQTCHYACQSCSGPNPNQCYACNSSLPYWLSGTTCNETCLTGYGFTDTTLICVYCDLKCIDCYNTNTNCSTCKTSGSYQSYHLNTNNSCVTTCPNGFFANRTLHTCDPCNVNCTTCVSNADRCLSCVAGWGWNNYICYQPCPLGTFNDLGGINCTNCSPYCISCQTTPTFCFDCTLTGNNEAYWMSSNNSCQHPNCPVEFYKENHNLAGPNECLACDISCYLCTNNPTPCQQCNPTWYLYLQACGTDCPVNYFTDEVTWQCLLCETNCTNLTLNMYFPNTLKKRIYVDMKFTEELDFTVFPYSTFQSFTFDDPMYTIDMFSVTYQFISNRTYRVILQPKGYIFLYNITIRVTSMEMPDPIHEAVNGRPFRPENYLKTTALNWFVIVAPAATDLENRIIETFTTIGDAISNYTTLPYVQEIKKSGVLALLMPGAQITSCSILVNNIPSQNFYEGVRFWASMVFFDVPAWEQGSFKVKHVIAPSVNDLTQDARLLFDLDSIDFRFYRTGHTTFFIFDVYIQIFLIILCWVILVIATCIQRRQVPKLKQHMGKIYSTMHKIHEISLIYIGISTLLEWVYFDANSVIRWVSLGVCILANVYFLLYELWIYHDLVKYPAAVIGNEKYDMYVMRYGSLLKNIRFEEYDPKESWSPKHWFRPYNYHILSFYKKLMMIASLPLFYSIPHAQISVLMLLQALEIVRFVFTWPFISLWRNFVRLVLQGALLVFFATVLIQGIYVTEIMLNNESTLGNAINEFYKWGWVGFAFCYTFNVGFVILMIIDIVRGCRMTNREMMDEARRHYYFNKLKTYEQQNEDVPLPIVNKWVKLGNLNKRDYDDLPDINLRVEYFRINRSQRGYEVEMKKLLELYMNIEFNFHKENNITVGRKMNKKFTLTPQLSPDFYQLIDRIYQKYNQPGTESVAIKTFQKVEQSTYKPGDKINLVPEQMTQTIEIESYNSQKRVQHLSKRLQGFPIPANDLQAIQ